MKKVSIAGIYKTIPMASCKILKRKHPLSIEKYQNGPRIIIQPKRLVKIAYEERSPTRYTISMH